MSTEEVKLRLIFANDNNSEDISTSLGVTVRHIKGRIVEQHWPTSLPAIDTVERIRLFSGGKEIGGKGQEDGKTLKEAKIVAVPGQSPTPVHVQPVLKPKDSTLESTGAAKPSQCFCTIL